MDTNREEGLRLIIRLGSGRSRIVASRPAIMSSGVDSRSRSSPAPSQPRLNIPAATTVSPSATQISKAGRMLVSISQ